MLFRSGGLNFVLEPVQKLSLSIFGVFEKFVAQFEEFFAMESVSYCTMSIELHTPLIAPIGIETFL